MINNCQQIYQSLLLELEELKRKDLPFDTEIEYGFQYCYLHWNRVLKLIDGYDFKDIQEEINFFKKLKPLFTSEILYFNFLYHSQLFKPQGSPDHSIRFWQREHQRLARFKKDHTAFYIYYKSGCTCNDHVYFTRNASNAVARGDIPCSCRNWESSHDHLVAQIIALEKYVLYTHDVLWWLFVTQP